MRRGRQHHRCIGRRAGTFDYERVADDNHRSTHHRGTGSHDD